MTTLIESISRHLIFWDPSSPETLRVDYEVLRAQKTAVATLTLSLEKLEGDEQVAVKIGGGGIDNEDARRNENRRSLVIVQILTKLHGVAAEETNCESADAIGKRLRSISSLLSGVQLYLGIEVFNLLNRQIEAVHKYVLYRELSDFTEQALDILHEYNYGLDLSLLVQKYEYAIQHMPDVNDSCSTFGLNQVVVCVKIACHLLWLLSLQRRKECHDAVVELKIDLQSLRVEDQRTIFDSWLANLPDLADVYLDNSECFRSSRQHPKEDPPQPMSSIMPSSESAPRTVVFDDQNHLASQTRTFHDDEDLKISRAQMKIANKQSAMMQLSDMTKSLIGGIRDRGVALSLRDHAETLTGGLSRTSQDICVNLQRLEELASSSFIDTFASRVGSVNRFELSNPAVTEQFSAFLTERDTRRRGVNQMLDSTLLQTLDSFMAAMSICHQLSEQRRDPVDLMELQLIARSKIESSKVLPILYELGMACVVRFRAQAFLQLFTPRQPQPSPLHVVDCHADYHDGDNIDFFQLIQSIENVFDNLHSGQFQAAANLIDAWILQSQQIVTRMRSFNSFDTSALDRIAQLEEWVQNDIRKECLDGIAKLNLVKALETSLVRMVHTGDIAFAAPSPAQWMNPKSVKISTLLSELANLENSLNSSAELDSDLKARGSLILRVRSSLLRSLDSSDESNIGESLDDIMVDWLEMVQYPRFGRGSLEIGIHFEMSQRNKFISYLLSDSQPEVAEIIHLAYGKRFSIDKEDQTILVVKYCSALLDLECSGNKRYRVVEHIPRYNEVPIMARPSLEDHYNSRLADSDNRATISSLLDGTSSKNNQGPPALVALMSHVKAHLSSPRDLYSFHPDSQRDDSIELLEAFKSFFHGQKIETDYTDAANLAQVVALATVVRRKLIEQQWGSQRMSERRFAKASEFVGESGMHAKMLDECVGDMQFLVISHINAADSDAEKVSRHVSSSSRQTGLAGDLLGGLPSDMKKSWMMNCAIQSHLTPGVFVKLRNWEEKAKSAALQNALIEDIEAPIELSRCVSRVETGILFGEAYQRLKTLAKELLNLPFVLEGLRSMVDWVLQVRLLVASENWSQLKRIRSKSFAGLELQGPERLLTVAVAVMKHNAVVETIVSQFWPVEQKTFFESTTGFFPFIDFRRMLEAVFTARKLELQTTEMTRLVQIGESLVKLKSAIDHGRWLRNSGTSSGSVLSQDCEECVAEIMETFPRLHCPRRIIVELEKVEQELQNMSMEMKMIEVINSGRSYLASGDLSGHQHVEVVILEKVVESAARLRHRNPLNASLFEMATKILNLRRAVKAGDWAALRYWLSSSTLPSFASASSLIGTASDAIFEIELLVAMSKRNLQMHNVIVKALSQNAVSGSAMRLETGAVSVTNLLLALRAAAGAPKMSIEDEQLLHSAEKLKNIRICFLMSDYSKLIEEVASVNLGLIHDACLEEIYVIKKAVDAIAGLNRVRSAISEGKPSGTTGYIEFHTAQTAELEATLAIFEAHSSPGNQVTARFLLSARNVLALRVATRVGRWCIKELAEHLLSSTASFQHEPFHVAELDYSKEIFGNEKQESSPRASCAPRGPTEPSNLFSSFNKGEYGIEGFNAHDSEYTDQPHELVFLSECLMTVAHDPRAVPTLLMVIARAGVLAEFEEELLLIRNELYHKICVHVLRRCLVACDVAVGDAIRVVQHLGVKSKETFKLLHTAHFMRSLRAGFNDGDVRRTIALLGRVGRLNHNGMLSSVVAGEVERIYRVVCGDSISADLLHALDCSGPDAEAQLKQALNRSAALTPQSEAVTRVTAICSAALELRKARRSGVTSRVLSAIAKGEQILAQQKPFGGSETEHSLQCLERIIQSTRELSSGELLVPSASLNLPPESWENHVQELVAMLLDATAGGGPVVIKRGGVFVRLLDAIVASPLTNDPRWVVSTLLSILLLGMVADSQSANIGSKTLLEMASLYPNQLESPTYDFPFKGVSVAFNLMFPRLGQTLRKAVPQLLPDRSKRLWVLERLESVLPHCALKVWILGLVDLKHGIQLKRGAYN